MPNLMLEAQMRLDLIAITVLALGVAVGNAASAEMPVPVSAAEIRSVVLRGEQLRDNGELQAAQQQFDAALQAVVDVKGDIGLLAAVEAAAGYNLFLLNSKEAAEPLLKAAYRNTETGPDYLRGLVGLYLSELALAGGDRQQALQYADQAEAALRSQGDSPLRMSVALSRTAAGEDKSGRVAALLELAARIEGLPNDFPAAKVRLKTAEALLAEAAPSDGQGWVGAAYAALDKVLAGANPPPRMRVEALLGMARLYRQQNRDREALALTEQALALAGDRRYLELLAELEALQGDLLLRLGQQVPALRAYEQAVNDLLAIRGDLPINLPDGRSAIDTVIDPLHRGYVDLLLRQAGTGDSEQQALNKAMSSMEAIKEADLQDFFLGRCSISVQTRDDWRELAFPETVIVYPILLTDRLELLMKHGPLVVRRSVPVSAERVREQAQILTQRLHAGKDYRAAAKQLYQWLFEPIANDVAAAGAKLLLYVPDRNLRAVPYSVLQDGGRFLVEQYAIVTLPGLTFQNWDKQVAKRKNLRALVAGLSRPDGAAIDTLPDNVVERLIGNKPADVAQKAMDRSRLVEELSLPNIEREIDSVAKRQNSTMLLNNQFTASALKRDIETGDYAKVHIASHGYFGKNAKESFVMAYDQNLTLLDFEGSLGGDRLKSEPIDLLTLSACETAEGDDRMLLGFSGLAVKSNVLSAVGSLWSINDQAATEFMHLFYDGLGNSLNKAEAMRQAQIAMIKSKRFKHPFFWSPFILIGGWQ
ncbi:CHAT domain-containing protein [Methylomonas sp. UP202]|uniref:CHAT domain-containing protein n=1 Tax=Methylomonas sp. UP202 TaxID=3040943 RepID=UPI00247970DE|nr:CHAT domain-containing protein [Methylomonas sp. UP202]WGS86514.1 CHAT domain-containing protein [Methylomonas sp. UP202]